MLQRPGSLVAGSVYAGGVLEYAKSPLVLVDVDSGEREVALDNLYVANLSLGGAVHSHLRFDLAAPLFFATTGLDGGQGVDLGDLRVGALGLLVDPADTRGWGVGLHPWLDLPTGSDREFLGERAVAGGALVSGTRELERWTVTANAGMAFFPRTPVRNLINADALLAGVGGGYRFSDTTGVSLEARGRIPLAKAGITGTGMPWEATGSIRHVRPNRAFLTGGLAMALSNGAGAATFRVFLGGGFGSRSLTGPRDRDLDGLVNRRDDCPDDPETVNDYLEEDGCPDRWPELTLAVRYLDEPAAGAEVRVTRDGEELHAYTVGSRATESWQIEEVQNPWVGAPEPSPDEPSTADEPVDDEPAETPWSDVPEDPAPVADTPWSEVPASGDDDPPAEADAPGVDDARILVLPGPVRAEGTLGPCVAGVASTEVTGDVTLRLDLEPVRDALLQVSVSDAGGEAVEGATVRLAAEDPRCAAGAVALDPSGGGSTYVGPTTWTVVAEAPDYREAEVTVALASGDSDTAVLVLEPLQTFEKIKVEDGAVVLLEPVHFDTGRATLKKGSAAILDEVVAALQQYRDRGAVEVQGHTDNVGSESGNQKLSQRRAETVRAYLVDHGIAASRLTAKGYGETSPRTTNRTPSGRAENRRVEIVFVEAP